MKTYKIQILFLLLVSLATKFLGQSDVINTYNGDRIRCQITKEDSVKVYFKIGGNASAVEANLKRSEIKSIEYAPKNNQQPSQLMQNPENENINTQKDDYVVEHPQPVNEPEKKARNAAFISMGFANPVGEFAGSKLEADDVGPGMNGFSLGAGFIHYMKKYLGADLRLIYAQNELNSLPFRSQLQQKTDSVWKAEKANWRAFGINLGFIVHKEIKDFDFYARVSAGYTSLRYPDVKLFINADNYISYQSVTDDALSFGFGGGLTYTILEGVDVLANVDYLHSTFKYSEVLFIGEESGSGNFKNKISGTKRDVKKTYQNLFISLGLRYWF